MTDVSKLAEPFAPEKISWRVGPTNKEKTRGQALCYIDARDVMARLDEVCGVGGWQCRYPHAGSKTICEIGIKIGDEWVWKADGAGDSDIEAEKGAISDAFKRSAVKWGIGRYLYDLDSPWVALDEYKRILDSEKPKLLRVLGGSAPKQAKPAVVTPKELPAPDRPEVADYLQKVAMLLDVCDTNEEIDEVLKAGASQRKSIGLVEGSPSWGAFKSIVELGRQAVKVPA